MPFALPRKWKWIQLENLFLFIDYRGKTPTKSECGIRLITASNVKKGYIDHQRVEYISLSEYESRQSRGISKKGDILFTTEAPLGNAALADLDTYSAGQRVITLRSSNNLMLHEFAVYEILSSFFQKILKDNATGTTAKGIKAARLKKLWIPVPPLEEQARIGAKIRLLFGQMDYAEKTYRELSGPLSERFRQLCLEKAIQGKLVPQLESEPEV
ncbi:MAG: restriction endonuclease subunit S, partial [Sutterella sp.]|nr:restriction endonuclease subunit S [Sutterella sp.]